MTVRTAYRELYYHLTEWGRRAHGSQDLPEYNTILVLATLGTMNCFTLLMTIELFIGRRVIPPTAKVAALILWLTLVIVHYLALIRSHPGQAQQTLVPKSHAGSQWVLWVYPIGSVLAFFSLLLWRSRSP